MHFIDYRKFHLCGYLLEKFDDLMCAPDNTKAASESIGFECFFRKREQCLKTQNTRKRDT